MGPHRMGKTRSEIESNLLKEWGTASWTEEQIDKGRHVEKKLGMTESFLNTGIVDRIK